MKAKLFSFLCEGWSTAEKYTYAANITIIKTDVEGINRYID